MHGFGGFDVKEIWIFEKIIEAIDLWIMIA